MSPLAKDPAADEGLPQDVADAWVTVLLDIWQKDQSGPEVCSLPGSAEATGEAAEKLDSAGDE